MWETIINCVKRSTSHGLPNVVNDRPPSRRVMWLLLFMTACCIFLFHSSLLFVQLTGELVSISMNINAADFVQPDLLICISKPFAIDYLHNPPSTDMDLMINVSKRIRVINDTLMSLLPSLGGSKSRRTSFFLWNSINISDLYRAFGYRENELFLSINCNGVRKLNLSIEMNYVHLACWRITPDDCRLGWPWSNLDLRFYIHSFNLNKDYPGRLTVSLNGVPIEMFKFGYSVDYDVADSVIVYFLPRGENIKMDSASVSIMGGTSTEVKIKSAIVKHENRSDFKCVSEKTQFRVHNLLRPGKTLTFNDSNTCFMVTFQRYLYTTFNCIMANYPIPIDLKLDIPFCLNISNDLDIKRRVLDIITNTTFFNELIDKCQQEQGCTQVIYSTIVNYMTWPMPNVFMKFVDEIVPQIINEIKESGFSSPGMEEMVGDLKVNREAKITNWKQNLFNIRIQRGEYKSTEYIETIPYGKKNFISDTGGLMGFYVGASMLTLCEILNVIHHYICVAYNYWASSAYRSK